MSNEWAYFDRSARVLHFKKLNIFVDDGFEIRDNRSMVFLSVVPLKLNFLQQMKEWTDQIMEYFTNVFISIDHKHVIKTESHHTFIYLNQFWYQSNYSFGNVLSVEMSKLVNCSIIWSTNSSFCFIGKFSLSITIVKVYMIVQWHFWWSMMFWKWLWIFNLTELFEQTEK